MGSLEKANFLGSEGEMDICGGKGTNNVQERARRAPFIYNAVTPGGSTPLLKTLMSNECSYDCKYCIQPHRRRRESFGPSEFAEFFMKLFRQGRVRGLFLSSGVGRNSDVMMERMVEAVRLIRSKHGFKGYIHLKLLPGASRDVARQGARYADRMSINAETPERRLCEVATVKEYVGDIWKRQKWITEFQEKGLLPAGQTTQYVVGATDETDAEIIDSAFRMYDDLEMRRVYFSAFNPVRGTPLENRAPSVKWRQNRLYQCDFLAREYAFEKDELKGVLDDDGNLPDADPKMICAKQHFSRPLEINDMELPDLLRVPGIGPVTAGRILDGRKEGRLVNKGKDLCTMGGSWSRAKGYVKVNGWYQADLGRWNSL